jgi:hypothetical protein
MEYLCDVDVGYDVDIGILSIILWASLFKKSLVQFHWATSSVTRNKPRHMRQMRAVLRCWRRGWIGHRIDAKVAAMGDDIAGDPHAVRYRKAGAGVMDCADWASR